MQQQTASKKTLFSWALFDFANTGFYVVIITLVFPLYFKNVIAGGNEAYWGRTISASMLLVALLGPFLGSVADETNNKKLFLVLFTAACVAATAGLYGVGEGMLWTAVVLLIIANAGFEGGTIFYDAFLPEIATPKDYGKISGYGFGLGYIGSFVILLIVLPLVTGDNAAANTPYTFLIAAGFFGLFSLPIFLNVGERSYNKGSFRKETLLAGYKRLLTTFSNLRSYRDVRRFLLAFFIYNDGILTVILFAGIFAEEELRFTMEELVYFFMIVQGAALLGSLLFGWMGDRIGARKSLLITLCGWILVVVWAYFVHTAMMFYIIGAVAGTVLGSSQSTSRMMMALLTPDDKKTEFFGFYNGFFGKASAILGPLVFGEVAALLGLRSAMLVVGVMFVLGMVLLLRVPDTRASYEDVVVPQLS